MAHKIGNLKLDRNKLYYLASPYSHKSEIVRTFRKLLVDAVGSKFVEKGFHVFGPITESACYSRLSDSIDGEWDFWARHDLLMIDKCDALIVLKIKGWNLSKGVDAETEYAIMKNMPIHYLELEDILPELKEAI